jgi:hypothetical protein
MSCDLHPHPGPGLVAEPLPRSVVVVCDPEGKHRFFAQPRTGTRFGLNRAGNAVWSVCVAVAGRDYVVPPSWIRDAAGAPLETVAASAVILAFPQGGRR